LPPIIELVLTIDTQKYIFEAMRNNLSSEQFFDVARAMLLLCFKQYGAGDILESYMSNSIAIRACISLNLNKDSYNNNGAATNEQQVFQQTLLPRIADTSLLSLKARDFVEAEEMRRTMLVACCADRIGCATTLWPGILSEEDITTSFPRTTLKEFLEGSFDEEKMNRIPQYINSPGFFTRIIPDAEQLMFKGTVVLGKCAEVISRLPRDATKDFVVSMPGFQRSQHYKSLRML
jgi:hypothetical protein